MESEQGDPTGWKRTIESPPARRNWHAIISPKKEPFVLAAIGKYYTGRAAIGRSGGNSVRFLHNNRVASARTRLV